MSSNTSHSCDVLVCGGGIAGTMAAIAAARHGAHVILAERYGFLGGNATAGAVAQFNSWQTANGRRVIAGLAQEIVDRLRTHGGAGEHQVFTMSTGHRMDRVEYDPEILKLVLDEMVMHAKVQPLLHTQLVNVSTRERRVEQVQFLTKSGVICLAPRMLIDASGDMDALRQAGAPFLELATGESLQPATMMFRFGPIDFGVFDAIPRQVMADLARIGFESGALARAALHAARNPFTQEAWFNISRLAIDATDAFALGLAEIEGRQQAWKAAKFLQQHVPGCQHGRLMGFGTQVGIRETRRIQGEYVLTASDLRQAVAFEDAIAMGAYPIDIHPASGGGLTYQALEANHAYSIPYRSLLPTTLDNALVAGRGISATHEALAAVRVMTISMAVGQAAGTAAALACQQDTCPVSRSVQPNALQTILRQDGVILPA